jgi:hypothetical protein
MTATLEEALETAQADLAEVETDRDELSQRQRELDAKADDLRAEIRGLELALKRQQPSRPDVIVPSEIRWAKMSRLDAICEVLREEGPLGPTEISEALTRRGREGDLPKLVSASLNDLMHRGRVNHANGRRWVPTPRPQDLHLPGDTGGVTS